MLTIFAVSDSIGETANQVALATASQFSKDVEVKRIPYIKSLEDVEDLINAVLEYENEVIIISTIITVSETALRAVPKSYKEASLGLGASKTQTTFKIVIPAAKSGILAAVVLGVGRAIGEAMAILLVAGNAVSLPLPFNSVRFLTTAIVSEMGYASGTHRQVLFTIGLVLFIFIMVINLVLTYVLKRGDLDE